MASAPYVPPSARGGRSLEGRTRAAEQRLRLLGRHILIQRIWVQTCCDDRWPEHVRPQAGERAGELDIVEIAANQHLFVIASGQRLVGGNEARAHVGKVG